MKAVQVFVDDYLSQHDEFDHDFIAEMTADVAVKLFRGQGHSVEVSQEGPITKIDVITRGNENDR